MDTPRKRNSMPGGFGLFSPRGTTSNPPTPRGAKKHEHADQTFEVRPHSISGRDRWIRIMNESAKSLRSRS